jgi:hypothetical protein
MLNTGHNGSFESLNSAQFNAHLGESGYFHLNSAFEPSLVDIASRHLLSAFKSEHLEFVDKSLMLEYARDNPYPRNPDVMKSILSKVPSYPVSQVATCYGSVSLNARLSNSLLNLVLKSDVFHAELRRVFGQNSSLFMHLAPAVRIVYPGNIVALVPNHIDIGYNSHIQPIASAASDLGVFAPPFITAWIPLQGTAATHGGLRLYPGSFESLTDINDQSKSLWLDSIYDSEEGGIILDYSLGDCIFFHPNLVHGSAPNRCISCDDYVTDEVFRVSMDVRIFSESSTTTKHYISLSTGERFSPGEGPCAR